MTTVASTQRAFLRGQNQFMAGQGYELHAISSPGPDLTRLAHRDGVIPHAVPISRTIAPLSDWAALWRLYLLFRRIQPDIIHVSTPKAALLGALAGWAAQVPVRVFVVRGLTSENAHGARRRVFQLLERLTARLCHTSIFVSASLLHFARMAGIVGEHEGLVIGLGMSNGVDPRRFQIAASQSETETEGVKTARAHLEGGDVVIGFVGRLAEDKGLVDLARAWEVLREEFPGLRLLLVGPWEKEDGVPDSWRARLESDSRVYVAGWADDVVPYYRLMSVFVYPSHGTEGFPNAPMEAAAIGLPVVATRVVGCVDAVVDGVTGALTWPRDHIGLADAIRRYVADRGLRELHGTTGRSRVLQRFRQEVIWEGLAAEYERLLRSRALPTPYPTEALTVEGSRALPAA